MLCVGAQMQHMSSGYKMWRCEHVYHSSHTGTLAVTTVSCFVFVRAFLGVVYCSGIDSLTHCSVNGGWTMITYNRTTDTFYFQC